MSADGRLDLHVLRRGETRWRLPCEGVESAAKRRFSARNHTELAKGPARLATALDIGRTLDGSDICRLPPGPLTLLTGTPVPSDQRRSGPRTGVGGAGAGSPWRFWIADDVTVSPYRAHKPRRGTGEST